MQTFTQIEEKDPEYDETCALTQEGHDSSSHQHGDDCGHPKVRHGDHHDFLVGNFLHHFHEGHCDHHGVYRRKRRLSNTLRKHLLPSHVERNPHHAPLYTRPQAKPWYQLHDAKRFIAMLVLTGGYFLVELIWGLSINSLALIADSFHMLSDLIALMIGFYSTVASQRGRTQQATFGYSRMEVIGGLINGAFLLGLCLTLVLESIQRFTEPTPESLTKGGNTLIIVAAIGLGVNLLGLGVLGHSHGGHGHSHGGGGEHSHGGGGHKKPAKEPGHSHSHGSQAHGHSHGGQDSHGHSHGAQDHGHSHGSDSHGHSHASQELTLKDICNSDEIDEKDTTVVHIPPKQLTSSDSKHRPSNTQHTENLNIQAALLHVFGDALGSVAVIIAGIVIRFSSSPHRFVVDPLCTLFITLLIMMSTVPLLMKTTAILLQKAPKNLDMEKIQKKLQAVPGVIQVHDFHVWQLSADKLVGSLHVVILHGGDFMRINDAIKTVLHAEGVHASSVQPEFLQEEHSPTDKSSEICQELICADPHCYKKSCCA